MNKQIGYITIFMSILLCLIIQKGLAQNLRFNEIMPSNVTTLQDEDKDYPDWLELFNGSDQDIQLKDFRLSDDENFDSAWVFPNCQLKAGNFLVLFASGKDRRSEQTYWHTLIEQGSNWRYILPMQNIADWYKPHFDDSTWDTGQSGFGYADNDDVTIISNTSSIYLRDTFRIENLGNIISAVFHIDYDDGFIAYLNGTEIARSSNMGNTGQAFNFDDVASSDHEAKMYSGGLPEEFQINNFSEILVEGVNLLAIEVHNKAANSSDMSAIPFLSVERTEEPEDYSTAEFLSNKKNLHTNFKLDADGDSLFLFSPNGDIIDQLIIPSIGTDISLGYKINDFTKLYAFINATPELENTSPALIFTDSLNVQFNLAGGLYGSSVSVHLSSVNSNDTIYYTTDGSDPSAESDIYSTPFEFTQPITVRARILRSGVLPGKIFTNSYYPNYNNDLPVAFFSTNPKNLWDYNEGIYVKGPNAEEEHPYHGANFWQDWEKPAHIELFIPDENRSFSIDGGIKIFGNYSRAVAQKSLSVFARKMYGASSINCKLFDDRSIEKFESVVFRNSGNDWHGDGSGSGSMFRDVVMTKLAHEMQVEAQAARPVSIYLNGQYWGFQNLREKVNEHFLADQMNDDAEKIDLLINNKTVVEGSNQHYVNMINFISSNNLAQNQNYEYLNQLMDVQDFIRYNVAQLFYFNGDWPGNNIKYWRPQRNNGRWRWILYDSDFGLGLWDQNKVYHNTLEFATKTDGPQWPNPPWSTLLLRKLLENQSFKNEFINTFADHLNTTFKPEKVKSLIDYQSGLINNEMHNHISKWGGNYYNWSDNNNKMKQFADKRPGVVRGHLVDFFGLNRQQNIQLNISGSETATIKINTVNINQFPWNGIYFNNIPIQLTAIPADGYKFVQWQGDINTTSPNIKVDINANKSITAVFEPYQPGEYEGVIINEISYHATPEVDPEDWVELYNNSNNYIDLSNWLLKDSNEDNFFRFANNTVMAPNSYLVVARDLEEFPEVFPTVDNVIGQMGFGFNSAGECVRLFDSTGELKDQVCFANEYPWPAGADGQGFTLALQSPDIDNSIGSNWNNSKFLNGTPGGNNQWATKHETFAEQGTTELLNCFPNPFAESLYIPIIVAEDEHVKIDILNLNGRVIETLHNDILRQGNHSLEWNTGFVQPGFLIVRMQTIDNVQIKKVMKTTR